MTPHTERNFCHEVAIQHLDFNVFLTRVNTAEFLQGTWKIYCKYEVRNYNRKILSFFSFEKLVSHPGNEGDFCLKDKLFDWLS